MLATKAVKGLLYFLLFLFIPHALNAQSNMTNENWIIAQATHQFENKTVILGEYIRRDYDHFLGEKNFLQMYRFSFGWQLPINFTLLLGASYVDFYNQTDEFRTHQFLLYQNRFDEYQIQIINRFGIEQRFFLGDDQTGTRLRNRILINFLTQNFLGPSFYDEFFYVTQGANRVPSGLNENRFGYGIRVSFERHQFYLFRSEAFLQTLKNRINFEWWQFQAQFQF